MKLDKAKIHEIAKLARIEIKPGEEDGFVEDLNKILDMMDVLSEIDTSNTPPFSHFQYPTNGSREDVVRTENYKQASLNNAPLSDSNYFLVPKVIKQNE